MSALAAASLRTSTGLHLRYEGLGYFDLSIAAVQSHGARQIARPTILRRCRLNSPPKTKHSFAPIGLNTDEEAGRAIMKVRRMLGATGQH
jgi:hypothetical protein